MSATSVPKLIPRRTGVLPGFGPAMGVTVSYLSLVVLIPLAAMFVRSLGDGFGHFVAIATDERTLAALRLSFGGALIAAVINLVMGTIVAWVLVRYRFPGKRLFDAAVDLPFALPTAVAGITLTALFASDGWIGRILAPLGIDVAFTPLGVIVAMIFIGLPFVVRTVEPVLADLEREVEEAASTLGASRIQTVWRVILPSIMPAALTGFALAFARAVGEYGSIIFIAGNLPYLSEIAPLLIVIRLEEFDYAGAATIGVVMLLGSFVLLLLINLLQAWSRSYERG